MFPCIVKPCSGGSSVGVSKVENADQKNMHTIESVKIILILRGRVMQ